MQNATGSGREPPCYDQRSPGALQWRFPMNAALHPLDPLTADEISHAVAIVRKTQALADDALFVRVFLHEPPKEIVLGYRESEPVDRQAFVIVRDRRGRAAVEGDVSLRRGGISPLREGSPVPPPVPLPEIPPFVRARPSD